ncbi:hypothetical protein SLEP1_g22274 [Rubroshorea leprosula]|uniref:Uncharacterized protein n=1 Tax=Rubroshorea leprosula TaxID=152421 RepID=A0AAV5JES6_9ROSI|nr:hypothetical protein SLEP1_g22274 [Rubroshorea leprosula]
MVETRPQANDVGSDFAATSKTLAKKKAPTKRKASSLVSPKTDKAPQKVPRKGGVKWAAYKPPTARRLAIAPSSFLFEASFALETRLQTLVSEIIHDPTTKVVVDRSPRQEGSDSFPLEIQKSPPKAKSSHFSLWLANKNFKIVNLNEVIDLFLEVKKATPSRSPIPFQASF